MDHLRDLKIRFLRYVYDPSVNLKDRTFIVFSVTVLVALFIAVPCGVIMGEPVTATVSTFVGAVIFSIYVYWRFKTGRIDRARIVITIILIFVFLPIMFFTNGGVYGGTPVWLLLGSLYIALILEGRVRNIMLVHNFIAMLIYWVIGYMHPGLITEYDRGGNFFDSYVAVVVVGLIVVTMISFQINLLKREMKQSNDRDLFEQTATALVNAIDAKDTYTHGHSSRVADYSRKLAEHLGKTSQQCDDIYFAGLLHDVGKIGIPRDIINKEGKLTDEEYSVIKQHPVFGGQILGSIKEFPFLKLGANYHHERYDGKGYPEGLKGTDIPEIARIISVADAYDAMSSKRSYRDSIPQQKVREELIKGSGTQFDPEIVKQMQHLIDMDTEYDMQEKKEVREMSGKKELVIDEPRSDISDGILINNFMTTIRIKVSSLPGNAGEKPVPSMVLFDSLDAHYHHHEHKVKDLMYFEYGELWFDGHMDVQGARKYETSTGNSRDGSITRPGEYRIEAVRIKDHALIKIHSHSETTETIIALPDGVRFLYIGLTGEKCVISDVSIDRAEEESPSDMIRRIAEEITYIDGPEGDIPNVQIDGYRADSTDGIPIKDEMSISFHMMSLPTARLVWHCAYYVLFYADGGKMNGENYKEFALIRPDGETWESEGLATNKLIVNKGEGFEGWDAWKEKNKEGYDCRVDIKKDGDEITVTTENLGVSIINTTKILVQTDVIYIALTGDQCALTNIRIS